MHSDFLLVIVVAAALAFDFTNGFHDTANAMATSIATGALKPKTAVLVSGALNIVGAFLSTEVAKTISGGIVDGRELTVWRSRLTNGRVELLEIQPSGGRRMTYEEYLRGLR